MEDQKNHISFLWDVLKRYDHYIATTNVKASLLLGFLGMVIFGVILRLSFIELNRDCLTIAFLTTSAFLIISSVYSCWLLINVVIPNTAGSETSESVIFFGDVANVSSKDNYFEKINAATESSLQDDLTEQVYLVAKIAHKKFETISKVSQTIKYIVLPLLSAFICFYLLIKGLG